MVNLPTGRDRRRNLRAWMNRPGRIRVAGGTQLHMQLVDISPQGAAMYCSTPLKSGTAVEVQFHLNLNPDKVELTMRGRVDRSYARGNSNVVRILFIAPTVEASDIIARFVKEKAEKPE